MAHLFLIEQENVYDLRDHENIDQCSNSPVSMIRVFLFLMFCHYMVSLWLGIGSLPEQYMVLWPAIAIYSANLGHIH